MVPQRYRADRVTAALLDVLAQTGGSTAALVEEVMAQIFPSTATWGLDAWEAQLGITDTAGQDPETRRAAVKSRLTASGPATEAAIAELVRSVTGYLCQVEENGDYSFSLRFLGEEAGFIQLDLESLRKALETAKPAHLAAIIEQVTWADIEAAGLTWAKLEETFSSWAQLERAIYCRKAE